MIVNENQFQTESNEQWTEEKGWNGTTSGDCDRDGLQQRHLLLIESRHGNDSSLTNGSKSHLQWTVHTNTGMYHSRILATNYRFWLQRFDIKNTLCGSVTRFTVSHTWRPIIWEEVFLWVAAATRTYGERGKNVTTPLERGIHASDNDEKFLIISTLDETSNFTFIWMLPYFIKNQVKNTHTKSCWSKRIDKMILLEVQAWFVRLILKELNNLLFFRLEIPYFQLANGRSITHHLDEMESMTSNRKWFGNMIKTHLEWRVPFFDFDALDFTHEVYWVRATSIWIMSRVNWLSASKHIIFQDRKFILKEYKWCHDIVHSEVEYHVDRVRTFATWEIKMWNRNTLRSILFRSERKNY